MTHAPFTVAPAKAGAQPTSPPCAMRKLDPGLAFGQFILSACLGRQSKGRGDDLGGSS